MRELRPAIVKLFAQGKKKSEISELLNVPETTVRRAIKRHQDTGSNEDRLRSGRPNTSNTAVNRRKINRRITRNPSWSTRKLANTVGISLRSVQRILNNNLQLKSYKLHEAQLLTDSMKATRLERCKSLKRRFASNRHRSILFSDEKLFTIEQAHNHQNDRIWSQQSPCKKQKVVSRSQKPKSVMVWSGITHVGKTPLVFIDEGVKINQDIYQTMLENELLPWTQNHFSNAWTFQQDSAPAHKSHLTQEWIRVNFPDFISWKEWPPYSPDLNPMDYSI